MRRQSKVALPNSVPISDEVGKLDPDWLPAGGSGSGDVVGPGAATDGHVVLFDGTTGKLIKDGGTPGSGSGDVAGPSSSTNNHLAVFDGSTGKLLKDGGAVPGVYVSPDDVPTSPDAMDDEFSGSSLDGKWTEQNKGTGASLAISGGKCILHSGTSTSRLYGVEQVIGGTTTAWRFCMKFNILGGAKNYPGFGLYVANKAPSPTKQGFLFTIHHTAAFSGGARCWYGMNLTDYTSSAAEGTVNWLIPYNPIYVEIEYSSTDNKVYWRHSLNGIDFQEVSYMDTYSGSWFNGTPTHIGMGIHQYSQDQGAEVSYFRRKF